MIKWSSKQIRQQFTYYSGQALFWIERFKDLRDIIKKVSYGRLILNIFKKRIMVLTSSRWMIDASFNAIFNYMLWPLKPCVTPCHIIRQHLWVITLFQKLLLFAQNFKDNPLGYKEFHIFTNFQKKCNYKVRKYEVREWYNFSK